MPHGYFGSVIISTESHGAAVLVSPTAVKFPGDVLRLPRGTSEDPQRLLHADVWGGAARGRIWYQRR